MSGVGPATAGVVAPQATVRAVLARRADEPGALLPILHEVQDLLGCIPADVVPEIASALNLSRAEVHGVITYYHHFRSEPAGRHVIQVCRAEACQALGADALLAHAERRLGCRSQATSADGRYTLEPVFCLGLCASSPAIVIDERLHARVSPAAFDRLIGALEEDTAEVAR
ncbi:MAG: formate dehydrogenase subunit gamma [Methylibium sp.]|nr:formate dehydrogenase subunit gamma [Methylibium sp.]